MKVQERLQIQVGHASVAVKNLPQMTSLATAATALAWLQWLVQVSLAKNPPSHICHVRVAKKL
jgi:hypothetical protein